MKGKEALVALLELAGLDRYEKLRQLGMADLVKTLEEVNRQRGVPEEALDYRSLSHLKRLARRRISGKILAVELTVELAGDEDLGRRQGTRKKKNKQEAESSG